MCIELFNPEAGSPTHARKKMRLSESRELIQSNRGYTHEEVTRDRREAANALIELSNREEKFNNKVDLAKVESSAKRAHDNLVVCIALLNRDIVFHKHDKDKAKKKPEIVYLK
mmetsp:Transcript_15598/g.17338  ORF Transcript_15598/g.17338 Transcript_15598/m.17338 type:complete len:113 (+) Transcript_15598:578-916(+)